MTIDIEPGPELPGWSATHKQRRFLRTLVQERTVAAIAAADVQELIVRDDFLKVDASTLITKFVALPYRKAAPVIVTAPDGTVSTLPVIDDLEVSKFAIPVSELTSPDLIHQAGNSDLLFGEVREWNGHKFINALKGAPGAFARERLRGGDRAEVIKILAVDQYKYTKLFGQYYSCCGSCGAELTDKTSRDLLLGPDCRKKFGF